MYIHTTLVLYIMLTLLHIYTVCSTQVTEHLYHPMYICTYIHKYLQYMCTFGHSCMLTISSTCILCMYIHIRMYICEPYHNLLTQITANVFSLCPVNYSTYCIFAYNIHVQTVMSTYICTVCHTYVQYNIHIMYVCVYACVCLLCLQAGQLSYEEAIIAKQAYHQENKEKVKIIKEESEQIMSAYFREQEEQRKEMRKLVETIAEGRENVKEAKDKLQKMKQNIGMPVSFCVCMYLRTYVQLVGMCASVHMYGMYIRMTDCTYVGTHDCLYMCIVLNHY